LGFFVAMFLMVPYVCQAQTTSAQMRGTVVDPQGLPLAGAKITLTDANTGSQRTTSSDGQGNFFIPYVNPGTYRLQIEAPGFNTLQQTGIVLSANEERSVGSIALQIGAVTQSVTVSAEAIQVQTASGENSALVSNDQIQDLQSRGRDVITLLRVLPGVNGAADNDAAGGAFGTFTPTISGLPSNLNNVTIDGQNRTNTDVTQADDALISMDAVQEVKVLTNGYQAEYGRNAGGTVNIVTKSGTNTFHGTAYEFFRNEDLNANSFQRKQNQITRGSPALYRYNTFGGTLGGPSFRSEIRTAHMPVTLSQTGPMWMNGCLRW
jgi:Carboxypeptidase regulatory-like domain/TonB-dependent Receptor Plug Domain